MKGFEGDDVSAFTAIHRTVSSYSRDRRKKIQYLYQFLLGSCSKKTFLMTSVQAEEKIKEGRQEEIANPVLKLYYKISVISALLGFSISMNIRYSN